MVRVFPTVLMLDIYFSSQFLCISEGIHVRQNGNIKIHLLMKLLDMLLGFKLYTLLVRGSIALGGASKAHSREKRYKGEGPPLQ